ncbi:heat-shock protein [Halobacteriales archaeon SW_10_66_29]|nr:MAG: heat-shock protein [Halobacteriales archaeon SW_10_66_29]
MSDRPNPFSEIEQLIDEFTQFGSPLDRNRKLHVAAGTLATEHEGRYVTRERATDAVERTIQLPAAVDEEGTEASYDRGVLTVRLHKLTGSGDGTEIPVN